MQTDVQIAQAATLQPIARIAAQLGIAPDDLEQYGKYKAKINPANAFRLPNKHGKLVLVTAINPTPAGEGKTTLTIGLTDALNRIGKQAIVAMREPSLGPVFGIKGGRRLRASCPDGRHQPAFHGRFSRHRCRQQPARRHAG